VVDDGSLGRSSRGGRGGRRRRCGIHSRGCGGNSAPRQACSGGGDQSHIGADASPRPGSRSHRGPVAAEVTRLGFPSLSLRALATVSERTDGGRSPASGGRACGDTSALHGRRARAGRRDAGRGRAWRVFEDRESTWPLALSARSRPRTPR
jgi:hypothetical protein